MLEITDERWKDLRHAYGSAENIPQLLQSLTENPNSKYETYTDEPYYTLWSALCHQGDVYTASYAAFPHLIEICHSSPKSVHWSVMQLAVHIEMERLINPETPKIPDFLKDAYVIAKQKIASVSNEMMQNNPSEEIAVITMMSIALKMNDGEWAQSLSEFNPRVAKKFLEGFWEGNFNA